MSSRTTHEFTTLSLSFFSYAVDIFVENSQAYHYVYFGLQSLSAPVSCLCCIWETWYHSGVKRGNCLFGVYGVGVSKEGTEKIRRRAPSADFHLVKLSQRKFVTRLQESIL